ncbi:cysteate synthase [hydrocarbon metagenome]|uniref:Cysteate synthase n=1 Tax=hydrocarbon metagenome TaxID=938273 RepID=A0A0W8FQF9_9ZZZZ
MTTRQIPRYTLRCRQCGKELSDDGLVLTHAGCDPPALLQTIYAAEKPESIGDLTGIFRYGNWLPLRRTFPQSSAAVTYRSEKLACRLGLDNLFITFNGYWPERNAFMRTCSFKELEAYAVCARLPDHFRDVLVIASAGNTARAFIHVCSAYRIRALIVVPEWSLPMLWQEREHNNCVRVVAVGGGSDYADAISLAESICGMDGFVAEGGALNVARRDGLGTTVLSCTTQAGRIPDEYFQAVGSGTGAIAAWETSVRLSQNNVFSGGPMRLHVSQNLPFAPIYESWAHRSRRLVSVDSSSGFACARPYADVLFNRRPPYSIAGGVYDALCATNGHAYGITSKEAIAAAYLFEETEGIDIDPAAAVAVACLVNCAAEGKVRRNAFVMLNITGGGLNRLKQDAVLQTAKPLTVIDPSEFKNFCSSLVRDGLWP